MNLGLQDKVALVTGAAGAIGGAIAAALLREGCIVVLADLNPDAIRDNESLRSARAHPVALDVGDASAAQHVIEGAARAYGRLDILVNCAGILKTRPLAESTIADWDQVCRVNLSGVYYCSLAAMPIMKAQQAGKIVNIASVSATKGGGAFGNVLYGTSKAGVVAFTQGFARELGPFGINVNAISPGVIDGPSMTTGIMTPEVRAQLMNTMPLRRLVDVDEVAELTVFLASDAAQAITGQAIAIDRGFLIR